MSLIDTYGRRINYLRLSVTDLCNLRCTYCMPAQGVEKIACDAILRYEQLLALAAAAVRVGIEKIRVTGGEPLVRKGLPAFLEQLAKLSGLRQLVLTTNGVLLAEQASALKAAGVQRLNISLDSLRPETFAGITRGGDLARVLAGIAAADGGLLWRAPRLRILLAFFVSVMLIGFPHVTLIPGLLENQLGRPSQDVTRYALASAVGETTPPK